MGCPAQICFRWHPCQLNPYAQLAVGWLTWARVVIKGWECGEMLLVGWQSPTVAAHNAPLSLLSVLNPVERRRRIRMRCRDIVADIELCHFADYSRHANSEYLRCATSKLLKLDL